MIGYRTLQAVKIAECAFTGHVTIMADTEEGLEHNLKVRD